VFLGTRIYGHSYPHSGLCERCLTSDNAAGDAAVAVAVAITTAAAAAAAVVVIRPRAELATSVSAFNQIRIEKNIQIDVMNFRLI